MQSLQKVVVMTRLRSLRTRNQSHIQQLLIPFQIEATGESAEPEYKFEALVTLDKVNFRWFPLHIHRDTGLLFLQVELRDGEEDEDVLFDVYAAQGRVSFIS